MGSVRDHTFIFKLFVPPQQSGGLPLPYAQPQDYISITFPKVSAHTDFSRSFPIRPATAQVARNSRKLKGSLYSASIRWN